VRGQIQQENLGKVLSQRRKGAEENAEKTGDDRVSREPGALATLNEAAG
jgi:hypothetical protein